MCPDELVRLSPSRWNLFNMEELRASTRSSSSSRRSCISSPSSFALPGAAMRCMTRASRTFYAFLLKPTTSTVKGSRERAAKGFWKKASLKDRRRRRRVRRRRLTTDVDPPIEISRGRGRVHRFPLVQLILINPGGKMLALPSPLYLPANSNYRTGPFDFLENNPAIGDSFRRFST